jgi:hypothetical protein
LAKMHEAVGGFAGHCAGGAGGGDELLGGAIGCAVETGVGEGGEDVFGVGAGDVVEVEVGGVEFGAEFCPLGFFPEMDAVAARAFEVAAFGQRDHVVGRAGELEHPLADPVLQRFLFRPRALVGVGVRPKRGELLDDEEVEMDAADLLPRDIIKHG